MKHEGYGRSLLISKESFLGKGVAAGCRTQQGWEQAPPLSIPRAPGDAPVTRWPCLAGDPAPQTVPSPCSKTGGMDGHWDRAGGCAQGRNCCSSNACLRVSTALRPVVLVPGQPWLPHAPLLPREPGSKAPAPPWGGRPRSTHPYDGSKIRAPSPPAPLFVLFQHP